MLDKQAMFYKYLETDGILLFTDFYLPSLTKSSMCLSSSVNGSRVTQVGMIYGATLRFKSTAEPVIVIVRKFRSN